MTDKSKDQNESKDAERRDEVLERMLKTPPKPHKDKVEPEKDKTPDK